MKKLLAFECYSHEELINLLKEVVGESLKEHFRTTTPTNTGSNIDVLSSKDVCDLLHISAPTLSKYRLAEKIKARKVNGKYFYLKAEVEKFLNPNRDTKRA